jgi:hypothetical protein
MNAQHTPGPLAAKPAWPMFTGPVFDSTGRLMASVATVLLKFDSLWCSEDNRVRVASVGDKHYVSIDGDNFSGPHKTLQAAREYGVAIANATGSAT